jgi:hypothetical protein
VLAALGAEAATPGGQETVVDYITRFQSIADAAEHVSAVRSAGGSTAALDAEGRVLRVTARKSALRGVSLPEGSKAALNARVQFARTPETLLAPASEPLDGLFTARLPHAFLRQMVATPPSQ